MLKSIALIVLLALAALPAFAQRFTYPSELARTLDSLDRTASEGLFRHAQNENGTAIASSPALAGAELKVMPVSSFASYNSSFPFGDDDGALWQGRGISGISRAGAEIAWDWASIRLDPEWWFAQNQDYSHASSYLGSTTGDYYVGLDRLQSYGSGFYQSFGWGQSEVRLRYGGFTLGFGTENLKLGPAEIQNIILSDNASGFPLLDIGTDGPISTWLGSFDARLAFLQTDRVTEGQKLAAEFICSGCAGFHADDLVPVNVDAIVFWLVWNAEKSILEVQDFDQAISLSAQTALRESIGRHELSQMVAEREMMGHELQRILDEKTTSWGITVQSVEIRDVQIPKELEEAMSRVAQAERERQARIILGDAETQISEKFAEAAKVYQGNGIALHLRAMNMLYEAIKEKGSMIIVPSSAVETMGLGGMLGVASMGGAKPQ